MHFSNERAGSIRPGSKATLVAHLLKEKIPVESGFVIGAPAFDSFIEMNSIHEKLEEMLQSVDVSSLKEIQSVSRAIKRTILQGDFPEEIARQILQMYISIGQPRVMLSPSFFGQNTEENPVFTEINSFFFGYYGDANLFEGIKEVWSRFFDAKPLFYRLKHGRNHFSVPFSICVQKQPSYKTTAVIFTDDPTSQTKQTTLVKAVFGEGALMDELEGADYYWVKRGSGELYNSLFDTQQEKIESVNGRVHTVKLSSSQKEKRKLSAVQLEAAAKLANQIQQKFFFPQICRVGFDGNHWSVIDVTPFSPNYEQKKMAPAPVAHSEAKAQRSGSAVAGKPRVGLIHSLSGATHLPQATAIEGHLSLDPSAFLHVYSNNLTPQKKKAFTYELQHSLEFILTHTHAHQGFLYSFDTDYDNTDALTAQLEALVKVHTTHPALPIGLTIQSKTTEEYQRTIALWMKSGLPRSSKISHIIRLSTPASMYHIAAFTQVGVDSILIDLDALSHAVHGGIGHQSGAQDSEALLDMVHKAVQTASKLGIGIILQSQSVPSHAMLNAIQSSVSVEWLTTAQSYRQLTTK